MGDIHNGSNWKFWRGNRTKVEPNRSSAIGQECFRAGRHYYLTQAVVHGINNFGCPQAYVNPLKQASFERGFDWEIADCFNVVRSSM